MSNLGAWIPVFQRAKSDQVLLGAERTLKEYGLVDRLVKRAVVGDSLSSMMAANSVM